MFEVQQSLFAWNTSKLSVREALVLGENLHLMHALEMCIYKSWVPHDSTLFIYL